ncbi:MAG: glycine--tRNA ligase subunit beta [Candidatus Muproteobacteria bacterium RIFCSPHIGHO2_02_FULL_60_13]|nr:MAG: glycine--tRNA ligase subunit beta [Candidatus Muproteobacteria bacterium RIFCSPHIGHO2_01_60_12]OGI54291.1 MAG: glycine--tRNA ligase subunit beta [Candidatus Muproteobacteria bacterium RIFCSPHIGHO2_02_FULL_60_13]
MTAPLLVELLTEELPPKALARLMEAFSRNLFEGLKEKNFLAGAAEPKAYATPRRLAVVISQVLEKQPDRLVERKGPALATALDAAGRPTPALIGFAKSCGVDLAKLEKRSGDKGEYFVYCFKQKGEPLKQHLATIVEAALKRLPIPKLMRWGDGEAQFVRPVHGVILLHGNKVVPGTVLGLKSGNKTRGHRFLSKGLITIKQAKDYEKILKQSGKVYAAFEVRRAAIRKALDAEAKKMAPGTDWNLGKSDELVDEVTSLVEYPVVLAGSFDQAFLEVPKECLIISMQQQQKYFPLADKEGKLLPRFLFLSNMQAANPREIVHGNERVLRARLSDARFFYDQDRKHRLADRLPRLGNVVYHNKLGSQLERVQRLEKLSGKIAQLLKADRVHAERAAQLCKADLLTEMVGEFPELQGIMGRYYAKYDHEPTVVADAVEQHYWPRTAGGELPKQPIAVCVALADKLDTLVGIYGIGLVPTGETDPFGLRRAALGVVRILVEKSLALDVKDLLARARSQFPNGVIADTVVQDLHAFMLERLKPYLKEKGFEPDEIDAVVSLNPARLDQALPRLQALKEFRALPEGQALAAANKRIRNILRQAGGTPSDKVDTGRLAEPAERQLSEAVQTLEAQVAPLFKAGNYAEALKRLAGLRPAVDEFFDKVMVMVDDSAVRDNRLALLNRLSNLFLSVADISRLQS